MSIPSLAQFKKGLAGTPMASEAAAIYSVARRNGVNPAFVAGLAGAESSFGSAGYARGTHNPYGYGVHSGFKYKSYAQATDAMTRSLHGGLYYGAGIRDINGVINKYTPSSDGNNPTAHVAHIKALGSRTGGDASVVFIDPESGASVVGGNTVTQTPGQTNELRTYIESSLANRHPHASLFHAVMSGVQAAQTAHVFTGAPSLANQVTSGHMESARRYSGGGPVGAAKGVLGTPYSWGGGGPGGPTRGIQQGANTTGFDCSSLMQYAWSKVGVKIGRTTYDQIKEGRRIPNIAQAKPGDLLFPSTHHVQMYLGNGMVIEAPQTGGHVQIVKMRPSYIAIRRPGG